MGAMKTGLVQATATPVERAWEPVLREAGATTHFQKMLRQTNLQVDPSDERGMHVVATGLPIYGARALSAT